ncbi:zinc-dependent peptidase [Allopusillimonas soli]|uniref:Zinc-dependent peptidase n=1 Tax=Allopusillimonas soli TaxID=659016 RepID=A0A853F7S5_9BURK|nr:M90 family metallopeptidase [Allopusillimonas soli]NYT36037.1 zinc-dependent peptidase [Allopusillimonas soli]TEA76378.1 zinc-dependent peptidase [Allopusillimonas soli]
MFRWLSGKGATQRGVERTLAQISDDNWKASLQRHDFLAGLSPEEEHALRQRAAWLLASKTFSGAGGLVPTDGIMLSVAIQAALPILALDPRLYEGWTEIILYPGGFLIPRVDMDEAGIVHEYVQEASGEAWEGGPVILSWEDSDADPGRGTNVVIHEFAHKLDLYAGEADGMPSLGAHPDMRAGVWRTILQASFEQFNQALTEIEDAIPHDVDPESEAADPWFAGLPLDPYAATDEAEFFAVSSEAFFVSPEPLARCLPDWFALLRQYYRQDPLARLNQTVTR